MFSLFRSRGSCYCLINNDFQLACQWGTCGAGDILLPFDWKISRLPDGQLVFLSQRANIPSVHHTPLRCEASENRWWYTNKKKSPFGQRLSRWCRSRYRERFRHWAWSIQHAKRSQRVSSQTSAMGGGKNFRMAWLLPQTLPELWDTEWISGRNDWFCRHKNPNQ